MTRFNPKTTLFLATGLFLLAACGQSPEQSGAGSPSAARHAAPSPDGDWVLAARSSGVELPLTVKFELPQRPVSGGNFPLHLKLESQQDVEGLSLRMLVPEGLSSVGAPLAANEPRVPAGGKVEHRLSLKAVREGLFEVRFQAALAPQAGKERMAVFSVPVIVSAP